MIIWDFVDHTKNFGLLKCFEEESDKINLTFCEDHLMMMIGLGRR